MPSDDGWIRRIRRCTASEILLLLEAQLFLASCELARRLRPLGELLKAAPLAGNLDNDSASIAEFRRQLGTAALVGWAVTRAAKFGVVRSQCLVRSLAIQKMLRRRGIRNSELRIGVRVQEGKLLAHAWVELYGAVVGDSASYVSSFQSAPNLSVVQL